MHGAPKIFMAVWTCDCISLRTRWRRRPVIQKSRQAPFMLHRCYWSQPTAWWQWKVKCNITSSTSRVFKHNSPLSAKNCELIWSLHCGRPGPAWREGHLDLCGPAQALINTVDSTNPLICLQILHCVLFSYHPNSTLGKGHQDSFGTVDYSPV